MDLQEIKDSIVTNVYHLDSERKVALHKHPKQDEIFYCIKGEGFGVFEEGKTPLKPGDTFIVPSGKMHSLATDSDLYVCSFLVPVVK